MTTPYAVNLYNSVKRGNGFIADITDRAKYWRRTIRRVGGFWQASFEYTGDRSELDDLFFDGLMREVREYSGGVQAWQGFIGDMVYRRGTITWRQSIFDVNNAIKAMYTRQYPNLITNGSAESGAWTAYNGATVTQSTAWKSDGLYSCLISATDVDLMGAIVQTGISLTAGIEYSLTLTVNVNLGNWRVLLHQGTNPALKIVAKSGLGLGVTVINMTIPDTSTYTGLASLRIVNSGGDNIPTFGSIYADGVVLSQIPVASDTGWSTDAGSISEYGRLEKILLEGALTKESADAKVATALKREAWPRLLSPDQLDLDTVESDSLTVSCYGYIFTLPWAVNLSYAEDSASDIVTTLSTGRDYVSSAQVDTNALIFTPDNRYQITVWQVLKTLVNSGDASGNLWALGMYSDRRLVYEQFNDAIAYRYRDGRLYNPAGGEMEAWLALPGWASLDDAPLVPYQSLTGDDDPRRVIVEEVEYLAPDLLRFRSKVID